MTAGPVGKQKTAALLLDLLRGVGCVHYVELNCLAYDIIVAGSWILKAIFPE